MYDHIGLKVKDLAASRRCYEAALAPLGAAAQWVYAANHQVVQAFYQTGLKAGASDNGGPGPRPDCSPTYYAAFLIDPDGNNVEAVCP